MQPTPHCQDMAADLKYEHAKLTVDDRGLEGDSEHVVDRDAVPHVDSKRTKPDVDHDAASNGDSKRTKPALGQDAEPTVDSKRTKDAEPTVDIRMSGLLRVEIPLKEMPDRAVAVSAVLHFMKNKPYKDDDDDRVASILQDCNNALKCRGRELTSTERHKLHKKITETEQQLDECTYTGPFMATIEI